MRSPASPSAGRQLPKNWMELVVPSKSKPCTRLRGMLLQPVAEQLVQPAGFTTTASVATLMVAEIGAFVSTYGDACAIEDDRMASTAFAIFATRSGSLSVGSCA